MPQTPKQKAIAAYKSLTRSGNLLAANRVFRLLRLNYLRLGLNDTDWLAQLALEAAGFHGRCSRNGHSMIFTL
ncbi:MAG: hypothetical protein FWD79_09535 [Desulfobulbus sp.]|nr:hypothetical protein [Desulfobulbus sp.]